MQKFRLFLAVIALSSAFFAFSIESYYSQATVLPNGDLSIYEKMNFTLEKVYNEGYRSIRPTDYDNLSNIYVSSVLLNGQPVQFSVDQNGQDAEIVWKKTIRGTNLVELNYTLKNRVELYSDFARICYEHLGSKWPTDVRSFDSKMILPASSGSKPIHFQIYSDISGDARLVDSSVITHIDDVYSGTYVGGCYLFDRLSVNSSRIVNGSAYEILTSDRNSYGSDPIPVSNALIPYSICCPTFIGLLIILLLALFIPQFRSKKALPETILPPTDSELVDVAVLLKGGIDRQQIASATILELINKGSIEILELEKKNAPKTGAISREETILFLKNKKDLAPHQIAMVNLIFGDKTEVNLDRLAADYDKIKERSDAQSLDLEDRMQKYNSSISVFLDKTENRKIRDAYPARLITCFISLFVLFFLFSIGESFELTNAFSGLFDAIFSGNLLALLYLLLFPVLFGSVCYLFINKKPIDSEAYWQWEAFERGLKSSRIKEYPPSAAMIWGKILVYATALGLATKVNTHLSEVDSLTRSKLGKMQSVSISSSHFYASTLAVTNLATYGSRSGPSSRSSGGWSSGGGGGFSSRSSGGGGFR